MELFKNDFCQIEFYPTFAVLTIKENIEFNIDKSHIVRDQFIAYYKNKHFLVIANRKNKYNTSNDIYKNGQLPNMKGLAIVSDNKNERDKAILEQKLFDKSFAFFETMEDAKSWAESYF